MDRADVDEAFAAKLNRLGLATLDQIDEARLLQKGLGEGGSPISLADALVQINAITRSQKEKILTQIDASETGGLRQLGQYKLTRKLGEGGMGEVYLAEDTLMHRQVAVKILPGKHAEDTQFLSRFRREARAAGNLNHVNICGAYAVGEESGDHYYVMEYCEGRSLKEMIESEKRVEPDEAVRIVTQAAKGLQYAHERGFIHRDIKPDNIMLTPEDVVKVLDLGLSKDIGHTSDSSAYLTQDGIAIGTPHYISPEQARGDREIDGRTDIYSLGATFYHLVTGKTPFSAPTAAAVLLMHLQAQAKNPKEINAEIPDGVVHVIGRMMGRDPNDRYADCGELIEDLELIHDGQNPGSRPPASEKSVIATPHRRPGVGKRRTTGPREPVGDRPRGRRGIGQRGPRRTTGPATLAGGGPERVDGGRLPQHGPGYLPHILGLGALVAVAALLFVFGFNDESKPRSRKKRRKEDRPAAKIERVPTPLESPQKNTPRQPQKDLERLEKAYALAREWEKNHPGDYDGIVRRFNEVLSEIQGTDLEKTFAARVEGSIRAVEQRREREQKPVSVATVSETPAVVKPDSSPDNQQALKKELTLELGGEAKMAFVLIPPGTFMMGLRNRAEDVHRRYGVSLEWYQRARPQHRVSLTRAYMLGRYEVTVAQFKQFVNVEGYKTEAERDGWGLKVGELTRIPGLSWRRPRHAQTDKHPVTVVSWSDARAFCAWASKHTGKKLRLPTEAEWEYACRGGTTTDFWSGDGEAALARTGWYVNNSRARPHACGALEANPFGLFDMNGNVWEWCEDPFGPYSAASLKDPKGPAGRESRVLRGGSWLNRAGYCLAAGRTKRVPSCRQEHLGFRVAMDVPSSTTSRVKPDAERIPGPALADFLRTFDDALFRNDHAAARNVVQKSGIDPGSKDLTGALKAASELLTAVEKREEAKRKATAERIGEKRTLHTKKGKAIRGVIRKIKDDALEVSIQGKINNQPIEYGRTIKLEDLTQACRSGLIPLPKPTSPAEWIAEAVALISSRDFDGAGKALQEAEGALLVGRYRARLDECRIRAHEEAAERFWANQIKSLLDLKSLGRSKAEAARKVLKRFKDTYGETAFARGTEAQAAVLEGAIDRALGPDPRIRRLFGGRVLSYSPGDGAIEVEWDLSRRDHRKGGDWRLRGVNVDQTGIYARTEGLRLKLKDTFSRALKLPQFLSGDLTVALRYIEPAPSLGQGRSHLGFCFHSLGSRGKAQRINVIIRNRFVRFCDPHKYNIYHFTFKRAPFVNKLPEEGKLEFSCKGKLYGIKLNDKVLLEYTAKEHNDHRGFAIGGGWNAEYTITHLHVKGRLHPDWLAKALKKEAGKDGTERNDPAIGLDQLRFAARGEAPARIGPYVIRKKIDSRATSAAYEAYDEKSKKEVFLRVGKASNLDAGERRGLEEKVRRGEYFRFEIKGDCFLWARPLKRAMDGPAREALEDARRQARLAAHFTFDEKTPAYVARQTPGLKATWLGEYVREARFGGGIRCKPSKEGKPQGIHLQLPKGLLAQGGTIEFWVRGRAGYRGILISVDNIEGMKFSVGKKGSLSDPKPSISSWCHMAVVFGKDGWQVYANGRIIRQKKSGLDWGRIRNVYFGSVHATIGGSYPDTLDGHFDNIRVWQRPVKVFDLENP